MEKLSEFLENVFEDEDTRAAAVSITVIVFVIAFFITAGVIVTSVSNDIRCMVSPETCITKVINKCPNNSK